MTYESTASTPANPGDANAPIWKSLITSGDPSAAWHRLAKLRRFVAPPPDTIASIGRTEAMLAYFGALYNTLERVHGPDSEKTRMAASFLQYASSLATRKAIGPPPGTESTPPSDIEFFEPPAGIPMVITETGTGTVPIIGGVAAGAEMPLIIDGSVE